MGAIYNEREVPSGLSGKEIDEWFNGICEDCAYSSGYGGYTGTFAEKIGAGVEDAPEHYQSYDAARSAVEGLAEKWGPAVLAWFTDEKGNQRAIVGAWCSS